MGSIGLPESGQRRATRTTHSTRPLSNERTDHDQDWNRHVRAWARKYHDQGLVVIGVHSPEFAYERRVDNVRRAMRDLQIDFPVAIDNDFAIWQAFSNEYWPAHYFVDARGRIRFHHFGEGEYQRSEQVIQQLLQEARDSRRGA